MAKNKSKLRTVKKSPKAKKKTTVKKSLKAKKKAQVKEPVPRPVEEKKRSFLEDQVLVDVLHQIAGDAGLTVLRALEGKELTDEDLSKRTGLQVNLVRRILYDLYENHVVNYRRVRDEESGWYVYFWKFNPERAMDFIRQNRIELLRKLEEKLDRERSTPYFTCSGGCQKFTYLESTENNFKCPFCGGVLKPHDNSKYITALERRIQQLREQLFG